MPASYLCGSICGPCGAGRFSIDAVLCRQVISISLSTLIGEHNEQRHAIHLVTKYSALRTSLFDLLRGTKTHGNEAC